MSIALTILPMALAIALGWGVRASGLVPGADWRAIETLTFRILIPAILIHSIAGADLSLQRIGAFSAVMLTASGLVGAGVLLVGRRVAAGPQLATVFQTSIRFNGFVSLAAADLMLGAPGLSLVAVSMAILIPPINVASIVVLSTLCGGDTGPRRVARAVVTNPLVIGTLAGIAVNLAGGLPDWMAGTVELVGRAALGVGLLAVGAGIRPKRLMTLSGGLMAGVLVRPLLLTGVFLLLGRVVGLSTVELVAGMLIFAVPAAGNGYIVTKVMGGDADLYADLVAWQTILSMAAIPVYAALVM